VQYAATVPTIKDRVSQMATVLVLEPIFEADLQPEQHAYRPGRSVSDKQLLHLIKMWLMAPVEETDQRGRTHRTTRNKDTRRGTPQGSPISPLLSNLYMRRFLLGWKTLGYQSRHRAKIVNYADDFVICCRGDADEAMAAMRNMMQRLKLTVNEEKTRKCRLPDEYLHQKLGLTRLSMRTRNFSWAKT